MKIGIKICGFNVKNIIKGEFMKKIKDLEGKKFKSIIDSEFGGFKITFMDNTVAYFECATFPDGTISEVFLDNIQGGN